ncbi:TPA: hypothetical protein ACN326_001057 [Vibrio parahaemolyticus]
MRPKNLLPFLFMLISSNALTEDKFDSDLFVKKLNQAIKEKHLGVHVEGFPFPEDTSLKYWNENLTTKPQDFGIVVKDQDGKAIEVFGESTPFERQGQGIYIPGYDIPKNANYELVGSAGWTKAVSEIATNVQIAKKPSNNSIVKAVDVITDATDYIAEQLCAKRSRPTKLTLYLDAGFELVFSASSGSKIEWDLEVICDRS